MFSYDKKRDDYVSSSSSKRGVAVDDYATSSKRGAMADYGSSSASGSKRSAIDDYSGIPTKRGGGGDYSTSKRDEYVVSKSSRDDYKREVDMRHSRYADVSDSGRSSTNFRSSGMDDMR